jgi:hypothetical protein
MSRTLTVAADVNTVDSLTRMTGQGSVSAPSLVVPAGMTKIAKVYAAASHDGAADDGSALFFLRLGGNAVLNGEQQIVFAGAGNQSVQSGSDAAPNVMHPFAIEDAQIEVRPGDTVDISAEFAGVDIGDTHVVATVVFAP